jgi:hypothetical protein
MRKRNVPAKTKKEQVRRQRDPLPWRYCLLTLVCGLLLVAGFFYAARQHFSAIDYGIKNAKLRQQKEDLQSEQRRLYLSREISLSPAEIKKAAKKIGLQDFATKSVEVVGNKVQSINPLASSEKKTLEKSSKQALVEKTAQIKESKAKPDKDIKENKDEKTKAQESADKGGSGDIRPRIAK